jgi:mRNA turnover protein 4
MFTDSPPEEVIAWFDDFHPPDFARSGNRATKTYIIPAGPVMQQHSDPPEPFPHNEEPQLRKLGLHTKMVRGVPTLDAPHRVCQQGKPLTPEQAQLLKLIGVKMIEFRIALRARWSAVNGEVVQIEGQPLPDDAGSEDEEEKADDVEAMSD